MMPAVDAPDWPAEVGTYLLIFEAVAPTAVTVGRLGVFTLPPGRYAYVGSGHGPGGLAGRLGRHLRSRKHLHWHVDYLAALIPVVEVIAVTSSERLECMWVRRLLALDGASVPIPRFGSSDCREGCPAHLVRLPDTSELHQP
jgi:Uri superfamily endonuclease